MSPKGYKKSQDDNLTKVKDEAEKANKTLTTKITQELSADIPEKKIDEVPAKVLGSGTKDAKARLPKVIVSMYDKEGNLVVKTYTCTTVQIHENTSTTLAGGQPTQRKDLMNISLEADVVEVTL